MKWKGTECTVEGWRIELKSVIVELYATTDWMYQLKGYFLGIKRTENIIYPDAIIFQKN